MSVTPIESFKGSWGRADYLLRLYDLLRISRRRNKTDKRWENKFKESSAYPLPRWGKRDKVIKVGNEEMALIAVRVTNTEWEEKHFKDEWLSELLCAALVSTVSAMDRYFHDLVVDRLIPLLYQCQGEVEMPRALSQFKIPLRTADDIAKKALDAKKKGENPQLRLILKDKFREELHRQTFQGYEDINDAFALLGLSKPWNKVVEQLERHSEDIKKPDDIRERLTEIVDLRNKFAHEGRKERQKKRHQDKLYKISYEDIQKNIEWIHKLVEAVDNVVKQDGSNS